MAGTRKTSKAKADDAEATTPAKPADKGHRTNQQDTERSQGFLGDKGEPGDHAVGPAADSVPDDASTDPYDAVIQANESEANPRPTLDLGNVPTVTDTPTPELTGEAYRRGYFGEVSTDDNDNRPDLTLSGVLADQNQEN